MRTEVVEVAPHIRLRISMYRTGQNLSMRVREMEVDGDMESFSLYVGWSILVARDRFPRITRKVEEGFWDAYIGEARRVAEERKSRLLSVEGQ